MRKTWIFVALAGVVGSLGCTATLEGLAEDLKKTNEALAAPKRALSSTSVDVIGASGGYQVRNVSVTMPDLSCSGRTYPETREAFFGGFKRSYIEAWNAAIDAQRLGVLTPKTAAEKKRRDYLSSHFIKWTKDAQDAMHNYETQPLRILTSRSPQAGTAAEREEYWRASCIRSAYTKGSMQGGRQADDDVRVILERAPPAA